MVLESKDPSPNTHKILLLLFRMPKIKHFHYMLTWTERIDPKTDVFLVI